MPDYFEPCMLAEHLAAGGDMSPAGGGDTMLDELTSIPIDPTRRHVDAERYADMVAFMIETGTFPRLNGTTVELPHLQEVIVRLAWSSELHRSPQLIPAAVAALTPDQRRRYHVHMLPDDDALK